jgi:heme/copper-type cytochrome/quinol oxidase subunit 1
MTIKTITISAFIAVILTVVIRVILRADDIHNILSDNFTGGFLLHSVIYLLFILYFNRRAE